MIHIRILLSLLFSLIAVQASASTLADVKARGKLICGVNGSLQGFGEKNANGQNAGFGVDFCKAVAAAVLGDAGNVDFVTVGLKDRFEKLQSGQVDLIAHNSTWTMERETKIPLRFVATFYTDGQGFMVSKALGVTSAVNLNQASICYLSDTTSQANVEDFFKEHDMIWTPVPFVTLDEAIAAYEAGKCDSLTSDQAGLYSARLRLKKPDDHIILADVISKEPLGPAVRQGDDQWFNIVRWTLFALINAEELQVKAASVDQLKVESKSPAIQRLLGRAGSFGADLGLDPDWASRAIKAVGNYGEMFDRNLGAQSKLGIQRGLNALWNEGGLLYAPPVR